MAEYRLRPIIIVPENKTEIFSIMAGFFSGGLKKMSAAV